MNPQIKKVTYYIETHLEDELQLNFLAKVAGYSPYHFCRIFKIHIGESALSYATRLKLERAVKEISQNKKSVIEIALDAGYQTPTGFLKAFKSRFGTTPTNYRQDNFIKSNKYKDIDMNIPEIVTREEVTVIFTRELGDYKKSSHTAWDKLTQKLTDVRKKFEKRPPQTPMNIGPDKGEAFGLCHDDPNVTDQANIRYEAAIAWNKEDILELKKYDFEIKSIRGGKYAKVFYLGASNGEKSWYGLYAWVEKNGYICRDEPPFEKYLNCSIETDIEKFEVEVHIPIE